MIGCNTTRSPANSSNWPLPELARCHHFALGTGHHAAELVAIAECLGMEAIVTT